MSGIFELPARASFGFSAENPTGARNGGSRGADCEKLRPCLSIAPGETVVLCEAEGPGMITHMWFTGSLVHSLILRAYWEGNAFPSVEAPLSAFLGCAYDENFSDSEGNYPVLNSALLLLSPARSGNAYFEMPFRRECRVTVENRGEKDCTLYYMISGWYGALPEMSGSFHAVYRQEHPVQRGRAYTILDGVTGRGAFLGVTLAAGMNGHNTCWVEGETKMYIDGDRYPTINYTGTEDYFCGSYAFGNDLTLRKYQTFSGLYVGLYAILGDHRENYNAQKRFLLYRFHVKDPIYFEKSFRMTTDNLGWTGPRYDDYTTVAYYYLDRPSPLPFALPEDRELVMR